MPDGKLGWVKLEWMNTDATPGPNIITAFEWAYNDVPNEPINAGQTSDEVERRPRTGNTALLALADLGAVALCRRRPVSAQAA